MHYRQAFNPAPLVEHRVLYRRKLNIAMLISRSTCCEAGLSAFVGDQVHHVCGNDAAAAEHQ